MNWTILRTSTLQMMPLREWKGEIRNIHTYSKRFLSRKFQLLPQIRIKIDPQHRRIGHRFKQVFHQRGYPDGQQAYKNVLNIMSLRKCKLKQKGTTMDPPEWLKWRVNNGDVVKGAE